MEIWDLYDKDRIKIGKTHQRGEPLSDGTYHLVVHVLIQNDHGELLLSKRHPDKHYGNLWECTGGSVLQDESSLEGALRETEEELGIILNPIKGKLLYSQLRKTHHLDMWYFQSNASITELNFQEEEVIDAKWVNQEMYEQMLIKQEVVPTLPHFYKLLRKYNKKIESVRS